MTNYFIRNYLVGYLCRNEIFGLLWCLEFTFIPNHELCLRGTCRQKLCVGSSLMPKDSVSSHFQAMLWSQEAANVKTHNPICILLSFPGVTSGTWPWKTEEGNGAINAVRFLKTVYWKCETCILLIRGCHPSEKISFALLKWYTAVLVRAP